MSHIPNSAIPHAMPKQKAEHEDAAATSSGTARKLADKARDNPRIAVAAGAAVVAGAIAAAVIPMVRSNRRKSAAKDA